MTGPAGSTAEPRPSARRLFLALWPDEATRAALARVAAGLRVPGARAVPPANLHLTLAFLGRCEPARERCVRLAAGTVAGEPFELELDAFGWYPRPRVAWVGARRVPPALAALQRRLGEALGGCDFTPEPRPFAAHVTLLRDCRRLPEWPALQPLRWPVRDFALVESFTEPSGASYQLREHWPLGG